MRLWELIRTGLFEIYAHKKRSFLSFLSISIGVAAMLYTFSQVNGMFVQFNKALDLVGHGRLEIERKEDYRSRGLSPGLTYQDALALRRLMPELHMVSPVAQQWSQRFRYGGFSSEEPVLYGVTPEWAKRDWVYTLRGRFINDDDVLFAKRVCVMRRPGGWDEKPWWAGFWEDSKYDDFAAHNDLLDRQITLGDNLFTVVGVIKEPPRDKDPRWFSREWGSPIYIPISTYQKIMRLSNRGGKPDEVREINIDVGRGELVPAYQRRIKAVLLERHRGEEDFKIIDFRDRFQNILKNQRETARQVMAVGIVAILAGGIGIMNVTLATIYSRIKEIGIRRAIGARRRDILLQFLLEAMTLGFFGGIAGIALGYGGIWYLGRRSAETLAALELWHFAATLAIAVGTGFIFSVIPAYQASRLDPVEALRYE